MNDENSQKRALSVTEGCLLRANPKNQRFARNGRLDFTGKSEKSPFCP
ncbi:vitamin B12-binding protein [Ligilactobacillus ruminis]|nr:vitamin B12-binding protein [Ligilactobacillus ruminis]UWP41198.1 vitamin B12-binding protein [Ligilactobacillus ruminis]